MKIIFVATTIAIVGLIGLVSTTQAAPTQWNTILKDQLYKSIISQALSQQEDLPSTEDKDKEMAAAYCKLLYQLLGSISENFPGGSVDDNCSNIEFPAVTAEPSPKEGNSKGYEEILALLKDTGLNGFPLGDLING